MIAAVLAMTSLGALGCSGASDSAAVASATTLPVLLDPMALPADEPHTWALRVHCGAGVFSAQLNATWWRAAEAEAQRNWLPTEWGEAGAVEQLDVVVLVNAAGDRLEVTSAGRTVVYAPTELTDEDYCD